jgi:hypothetical protein
MLKLHQLDRHNGRHYKDKKSTYWKGHESQILEQWSRPMQVMYSASSQSMNILIIKKLVNECPSNTLIN